MMLHDTEDNEVTHHSIHILPSDEVVVCVEVSVLHLMDTDQRKMDDADEDDQINE